MVKKQRNTRNNSSQPRRSYKKHIKDSLFYVAPHKHTGHRLHHRHSSHGLLFLLLIVTGIILFLSLANLEAAGITTNGHVNVNLIVPGNPPSTGAVITNPANKSSVKKALITVEGTCPSSNIIAVYNNGLFNSSSVCSNESTFSVTVQLTPGINTLQAQNYDALNQPGPATEQIEVAYEDGTPTGILEVNQPEDIVIDESIPTQPAPQPSDNPCYSPLPPAATSWLNITAPCITRNIFVGETLDLPITITGGFAPYAVSLDWGEENASRLYSLARDGHHILSHTFQTPKVKKLTITATDARGETARLETVVDVNDPGETAVTGTPSLIDTFFKPALVNWFESSVPLYWAAVALLSGFWIGDVFQRVFGIKKPLRRART